MSKFERVNDKWKDLRKDLYGNVEPEIKLEAITVPIEGIKYNGNTNEPYSFMKDSEYDINWKAIEQLPAIAAGVSYGSKNKMESDHERAVKLNKKLVEKGHHTPLESIQINLFVSGISKACGAQLSHHRIGQGHVSQSLRFKNAEPKFIYPLFDYLEDEYDASSCLSRLSQVYSESYQYYYKGLKMQGAHKEDARMVLPVSYATERYWWINMRALRDFFRLRLAADSGWEIRRLAWMIFDLVCPLMPSLFEDIESRQYLITGPGVNPPVHTYVTSFEPGYCSKCGNSSILLGTECKCERIIDVDDHTYLQVPPKNVNCCKCGLEMDVWDATNRDGIYYCSKCVPLGKYDG